MRQLILRSAQGARNEALNYMQTFSPYEHMWMEGNDSAENKSEVADVHFNDIVGETDATAVGSNTTYSFQRQVGILCMHKGGWLCT